MQTCGCMKWKLRTAIGCDLMDNLQWIMNNEVKTAKMNLELNQKIGIINCQLSIIN